MIARYERPATIGEATRLLAAGGWRVLAGGTDLLCFIFPTLPHATRWTQRRTTRLHSLWGGGLTQP